MFIVLLGNVIDGLEVRGPFEDANDAGDWARDRRPYKDWVVTEVLSQDVAWKVQVECDGKESFIFHCEASSYDNAVQLAKEEHPKATIIEAWEVAT
jgi:hypothetical protein